MVEVQDIFNKYGEEYRKKNKMMPYKLKTIHAEIDIVQNVKV